jgi:diacylglycerol kinase-like protein
MTSVGLIINDKSNRSAAVIDDLLHVADRSDSVRAEVLDGIQGLGKALASMNARKVDTLIIAGGDGTLQATFTDIINNQRFDLAPHYVALPCGMTNVIAKDCGLKGAPAKSLDNFLWRRQKGEVSPLSRPLLSVGIGDQDPIHGFFLGAGAFHSAVQFSRSDIQSKGAKRSLALVLSVFSYIMKVATEPNTTFDPVDLKFLDGAPAEIPVDGLRSLFMATTLSKLGSGIFPFWGDEPGAMAATLIDHPIQKVISAALPALRGKERPWFKEYGYRSWCSDQMALNIDGPFVFDGEIFHADKAQPTSLATTHNVKFLS